jgi:alkylation response protein AidB-like acyl-CoA dehydrogenase
VQARLIPLSQRFAAQRAERQARTRLERSDFDALAESGYLGVGVPVSHGGLFEDVRRSTRPIGEMLRTIARGDASVALVAAMHPAVLIFWAAIEEADPASADAWRAQRAEFFRAAQHGHWWGTITSEPGSGGDILQTRASAREAGSDGSWCLSGDKHFGSGSGITSFMITTALPDDSKLPDLFVFDMRGVPWDGSTGVKLIAEWDGHGMSATQSHAFRFDGFPARRSAWPGGIVEAAPAAAQLSGCAFVAVTMGVVEAAVAAARDRLTDRKETLRPYEQVEWTRAVREAWLCEQAYQGMLRAVESGDRPLASVSHGKASVAELAESLTLRLCKVVGGGSYSRSSPFGRWAEDVRALGFLRPPWGLAHDQQFAASWESASEGA